MYVKLFFSSFKYLNFVIVEILIRDIQEKSVLIEKLIL